jgi:hypothetical protein
VWNDARKLDKSGLTLPVQRFVALSFQPSVKLPPECPVPELVVERKKVKDTIKKFQLGTEKKKLSALSGC